MALLMTEAAKQHISKQLQGRGKGMGIRVGIKTAGCSGLSYVLEFVDEPEAQDEVFDQGDFSLIVDPKSLLYLDGTELDFVKEGLNEGFQFNNPNVKSECGCGESFHV
jgi:iron-sulfur cluster assembly protein